MKRLAFQFTGVAHFIERKRKFTRWKRNWFMKQNDNRLEILRFQGGYLYDKGENDELIYCVEPWLNLFTNIL